MLSAKIIEGTARGKIYDQHAKQSTEGIPALWQPYQSDPITAPAPLRGLRSPGLAVLAVGENQNCFPTWLDLTDYLPGVTFD